LSEKTDLCPEMRVFVTGLHGVIAAYHHRLAQVTSQEVADQFLATMSDLAIKYQALDDGDARPMDNARNLLEKLGMKLSIIGVGEKIEANLQCPLAAQIHPQLASKAVPFCPTMVMVLGALRTDHRNFIVSKTTVTETGCQATFEVRRRPQS